MSQDANEYHGSFGGEASPPPPGQLPYPGEEVPRNTAQDRVRLPAIFLIIAGVFSFMGVLVILIAAVRATLMSEAEWKEIQEVNVQLAEKMTGQKAPPGSQGSKASTALTYWGMALTSLVCTALTLLAGFRMLALKNYGLCVVGSLAAMLPCMSASGCCGLGEVAGIWALVVLMNDEIRQLFR